MKTFVYAEVHTKYGFIFLHLINLLLRVSDAQVTETPILDLSFENTA